MKSFTRYDFMTGLELRKELSKRFRIVSGKKSEIPLNRKNNPNQIRLFLTQDDLKHNRDPYVKIENPQPTFIGIVDKDVSE